MSRINNTIKVSGNTTTVLVTKNDDPTYLKEVVIDTANLHLLKKVRTANKAEPQSGIVNSLILINLEKKKLLDRPKNGFLIKEKSLLILQGLDTFEVQRLVSPVIRHTLQAIGNGSGEHLTEMMI